MLRGVEPADLEIFFQHQADPIARAMCGGVSRDRQTFFAHWQTTVMGNPATLVRTIVHEGAVAGFVSTFPRDGRRLVAYWLDRARWGRGIATQALQQLVLIEPVRPLNAYVATHNHGSMRVLEKCGFRRVGLPALADDGVDEAFFELP